MRKHDTHDRLTYHTRSPGAPGLVVVREATRGAYGQGSASRSGIVAGARSRALPGFLLTTLACVVAIAGCTTRPRDPTLLGRHHCESFFVYTICVADRDVDGRVDYMYFGDDRQIFMYDAGMREALMGVQPFHACAIPMSDSNRNLSSQLLYGDDLSLSARLALKGRLIRNYRAVQPAVEACNAQAQDVAPTDNFADPFLVDEDWDGDAVDGSRDDELPRPERDGEKSGKNT